MRPRSTDWIKVKKETAYIDDHGSTLGFPGFRIRISSGDGRKLSNLLEFTVSGRPISPIPGTVADDTGAVCTAEVLAGAAGIAGTITATDDTRIAGQSAIKDKQQGCCGSWRSLWA